MFLRKQLRMAIARGEGFEDGIGNSETEPLFMSDSEKVAYQEGKRRGELANEGIRLQISRNISLERRN